MSGRSAEATEILAANLRSGRLLDCVSTFDTAQPACLPFIMIHSEMTTTSTVNTSLSGHSVSTEHRAGLTAGISEITVA